MGAWFDPVQPVDTSGALLSLSQAQQDAAKTNTLWNVDNAGQQDLADRA
jgi:hypothetical protein